MDRGEYKGTGGEEGEGGGGPDAVCAGGLK